MICVNHVRMIRRTVPAIRIIAPESLASATFTSVKSHHSFWTETWANYLSKGYFGLKWLGNKIKGYPANNISDLNLLRLRIASIPLFY